MKAIACVDSNWGLGYKGDLLFHLKKDMRYFQQKTIGGVVVMGRKTLESLPSPLSSRVNVVITRDENYVAPGCVIVHSLDELFRYTSRYSDNRVFVIGGGEIYKMLIPFCDEVFITMVLATKEADTYFPNLKEMGGWSYGHGPRYRENEYEFYYYIFQNQLHPKHHSNL